MTITTLLFDLDGTLADSLEDLTTAVNHMRNAFSLPPLSATTVRGMVGKGARNLIRQALPDNPADDLEHGLRLFVDYNSCHIADNSRLYPGAREALEELSGQGFRMAVISNKNEELSRLMLETLGIAHYFPLICGGDTYPEMKPSPLPLLRTLEHLGSLPTQTVMVGDSINDIQAGKQAGIITIACAWGYGNPADLEEADYQARNLEQLGYIVGGLR